MKKFFEENRRLHIWLLTDFGLLAAFWLCRGNRAWMNALAEHVTGPLRLAVGRLCYRTEISIMEVLCVLLVLGVLAYVGWSGIAILRARGRRGRRTYRAVLGAVCAGVSIYVGFCVLWGINYYIDSFQDRSGIRAEPVAVEELKRVTAYFADRVSKASVAVPRDGNGVFAVSREEILEKSVQAYTAVEQQFPFLEMEDSGVKGVHFSKMMSRLDFTGVYCPFTGESNVNIDSPACMLPSTAAHEMAHQRGIASEQECNFLAILAATTCQDPAYEYSGWLMGYLYLGNALYGVDREAWQRIRDGLDEGVKTDLAFHSAYWRAYRDTLVQQVSNTVYDGFLKSYGDEDGIQSYGTVVDLLIVYYRDAVFPEKSPKAISTKTDGK